MTENIVRPLRLHDGYIVETVYYGSGTICISTQLGCPMACPFCASGIPPFIRNLTLSELLAQVDLHSDNDVKRLTLSGIGEPLCSFDTASEFITVSSLPVSATTVVPDTGLMKKLLALPHNGVMLSLHAGTEKTHKKLVPKAAPLDGIFNALTGIWPGLSVNKRRKTGFNYLLLEGVNDSPDETDAFIELVKPFSEATVHLLFCNPVEKSRFKSPDEKTTAEIYEKMRGAGINVRRANRWRKSREGGCGTLFLKSTETFILTETD